jgi:L-2-hydroxyglutarate oxidase LhgO
MTIQRKTDIAPEASGPLGPYQHSGAHAGGTSVRPKLQRESFVIVGGGIVGLAIARRLIDLWPRATVTVIEKEAQVGLHQTGHNSGVVHAGVYYPTGSLKARLCTRGRQLLKEACEQWDLPYVECGKLIVARDDSDLPALRRLEQRALANGVPNLRWLEGSAITEIEPYVSGVAALHSPRTAIVDFGRVAQRLLEDFQVRGGTIMLNTEVTGFAPDGSGAQVLTAGGSVRADRVVLCAGLQSDRVARLAGDVAGPAIVPFRGEYYRLVPAREYLVKGLVYPVPDPRYPFLGVHFTRRVNGGVDIGPNAVLALAREGYSWRDLRLADLHETVAWPGFRRMARRHWRAGGRELATSVSKYFFVAAARKYIPSLSAEDVVRGPAGVRAQAVAADGTLVDDFQVNFLESIVAVRNAPSPAATSSLAIAEHLVGQLTAEAKP